MSEGGEDGEGGGERTEGGWSEVRAARAARAEASELRAGGARRGRRAWRSVYGVASGASFLHGAKQAFFTDTKRCRGLLLD